MRRVTASQGLCEMADALSQMADVTSSNWCQRYAQNHQKQVQLTCLLLTVAVTVPQRDEGLSEDEIVEPRATFWRT
jgi:hypothetical protein